MRYIAAIALALGATNALMPYPRVIEVTSPTVAFISDEIVPEFSENPIDVVVSGFLRFRNVVFNTKWYPAAGLGTTNGYASRSATGEVYNSTTIERIEFHVSNPAADLQFGVNELYTLISGGDLIIINSDTPWGALNALSTLQQLIIFDNDKFYLNGSYRIEDKPYFRHRGIMLDTARNFLSIETIKNQIEVMALVKLNVLHWHIIDSQSWPLEVIIYPNMTKDAYSRTEVYTHSDIKHVVAFARARGVRVIPELDMPGHANAGWRQVDSDIVVDSDRFWNDEPLVAAEPPPGQLDPSLNKTYEVVSNVFNEVGPLFLDNFYHAGMDEIIPALYNDLESIKNWLNQGNRSYNDLLQYWVDKTLPVFKRRTNTTRVVMWADVLVGDIHAYNLSQDVVLQQWRGGENALNNLIATGHDVIVSTSDFLYLDCGNGGFLFNDPIYIDIPQNQATLHGAGGSWCGPYKTWQTLYDFNILVNLTESEARHVLGAEAPLWGEQIDDSVVSIKLWPRVAALAENLWSGNRDKDGYLRTNTVSSRILNFREYVQQAYGVKTHPLVPRWCYRNPSQCDITANQTLLRKGGKGQYYDF